MSGYLDRFMQANQQLQRGNSLQFNSYEEGNLQIEHDL
jgi:hypothetical protein